MVRSGRFFVLLLVVCVLLSGCTSPTREATPPRDDASGAGPYDPGWPAIDSATVRPGVKLYDSLEGQTQKGQRLHCSTNFIFSDPNNTSLYIGTASHCVVGSKVGDPIIIGNGAATGTIAYCSYGTIAESATCPDLEVADGLSHPNDFALIRIDDEHRDQVHPAVLGIGGPIGLAPKPERGDVAYTYGNTDYRDARQETVPDRFDRRVGRVWTSDDWTIQIVFEITGLPGDSGSLAMDTDGAALGIVQWVGEVEGCPGVRPDVNGIVSLESALESMAEATGIVVVTKTWPLIEAPPPLGVPEWPCHEL